MDERLVLLSAEVSERLFNRRYILHPSIVCNGIRYDVPSWLWDQESPDAPLAGGMVGGLPPAYAWDLRRAWQVVEHLRQQGWLVILKEMPDGFPFLGPADMDPVPEVHRRSVCSLQWISTHGQENTRRFIGLHPFAVGDSMPEAVCRCALAAVDLLFSWEKRHG